MLSQSPPEHSGALDLETAAPIESLGGHHSAAAHGVAPRGAARISMAAVIGSTLLGVQAPQRIQPQG